MKKAICSFIYYKLLGWKTKVSVPDYDKYIICAAPHTTNWDLFIGKLFMGAIGRETGFMMKKRLVLLAFGTYLPLDGRYSGRPQPQEFIGRPDDKHCQVEQKISFGHYSRRYAQSKFELEKKGFTILPKEPVCPSY